MQNSKYSCICSNTWCEVSHESKEWVWDRVDHLKQKASKLCNMHKTIDEQCTGQCVTVVNLIMKMVSETTYMRHD